jgi:hypothetical protein
LQKVDKR